jgi:hypothetical protein
VLESDSRVLESGSCLKELTGEFHNNHNKIVN